jgi:hypothetical protein
MKALDRLGCSLVAVVAAVSLAACSDNSALGPEERTSLMSAAQPAAASRGVDLGACDEIAVPAGSRLAFHAYAEGVQIYQWDGQGWAFRGPSATLFADAGGNGKVGIHYGGPTWESASGGMLVGALRVPCDVGTADIPWLLLDVVSDRGPGVFRGVELIQRVNTSGGRAPSTAGGFVGEVRNVPYTAEYLFYQAP